MCLYFHFVFQSSAVIVCLSVHWPSVNNGRVPRYLLMLSRWISIKIATSCGTDIHHVIGQRSRSHVYKCVNIIIFRRCGVEAHSLCLRQQDYFVFQLSVHPSLNLTHIIRDAILFYLVDSFHWNLPQILILLSGHCLKSFQGHRLKVKVTIKIFLWKLYYYN